ncbi:proline-rich receptor-like protein kinase PERK2 [Diospyros lotus]|uniref:proline-rich receptor-like protein kinase PERK2 n=1 Tax=Diospyros lotus TaxID=55363 RepID=UPI00224EE3D2|nr:proline-rich receptor-like protein kinase PERK2 [Diospyros lotus]
MASQQPPTRPWFRLASASRPTQAPAPAPAPPQAQALPVAQPRPPIIRSTFTRPFSNPPTQPAQPPLAPPTQAPTPLPVAAPPPPRATAAPTAPAPKSPQPQSATVPPATAFHRIFTVPPLLATAPPPASAQKSPPPRAAATPPSPPLAPASQSMTAVAPATIAASNGRNHSTDITRQDGKPDVRKDNGNYKKQSDSEEFGRGAITVAGDNKGAIMEWIPSNKKNSPPSIHKNGDNPRTWSDGEKYGSESDSSNEEGRGKSKDKSYKAMTNSSQPMSAFMNSNVQGVNNSILCNCSYSHDDPGLHFSLSRKPNGHGNGVNPNNKDHTNRQNI